ncbi:MAG: ATP-binding cassette domain-containing protein [Spirosomataceae bacterium]
MSIHIHSISKQFGSQWAVQQVSFTLRPGEIVGFLGPNGAGKSTTLKMITGTLLPDAGKIEVLGLPVGPGFPETRRHIGYLPEHNPLYLDSYVRAHLSFIAHIHQIPDAQARIEEVIQGVGLAPEAHKRIGQLSKGYRQRVGLAQAILHNPEVLILDEPTTGLDPNQLVEIRQLIKSLGQQKTVLFSTHILSEVVAVCDRVLVIHQGTLLADRPISEVKENLEDWFHTLTRTTK